MFTILFLSFIFFVPLPIITRAIFIVYHLFLTSPLRVKTFVLHFLLSHSYVFLYSYIMIYRYMYLLALKNSFLAFRYFKTFFFCFFLLSISHSFYPSVYILTGFNDLPALLTQFFILVVAAVNPHLTGGFSFLLT